METEEYYGGTYPEPPKEIAKERCLKLTVVGTICVNVKCTTDEIEAEIDKIENDLNKDAKDILNINVESWEEI